jgi:ATP-dependent exoDNAse (exonuclease V) beta subunit
LEWPVVIPLGLGRKIANRSMSGFLLVPDSSGERKVYFDGESLPEDTRQAREHERLRELVRLLYVTLTRARRHLILPRETSGAKVGDDSFATLWGGLVEPMPEVVAAEFAAADERPESPVVELEEPPEEGSPAPALPQRLLPHQLADKPDLIRALRHESLLDEPSPVRPSEDPIEYGLWWHETMEYLPWTQTPEAVTVYSEERIGRAAKQGFEARARHEWDLFRASAVWTELLQERWSRIAELSVFAPLRPDAWIDGVIDLVLQDRPKAEVWIVDWKTNHLRRGESREAILPRLTAEYQKQLGAYGACAAGLFPGSTIRVFLYSTQAGAWAEVGWT